MKNVEIITFDELYERIKSIPSIFKNDENEKKDNFKLISKSYVTKKLGKNLVVYVFSFYGDARERIFVRFLGGLSSK